MKKRAIGIFLMLLMLALSGCTSQDRVFVANHLGVDLKKSKIVDLYDDHDGFLGDGLLFAVIDIPPDSMANILEDMNTKEGWHPLPLGEREEIILYGNQMNTSYFMRKDKLFFPKVEKGYYFFKNRYVKDREKLQPLDAPPNFDVAILDTEKHRLYFGSYDS